MIHLQGREAEEHLNKFKIKQLPFEMEVDTVIKMKNTRTAYMAAEFIAKDIYNNVYYLALWSSDSSRWTETYSFIRIYFDLYHSYINGDISYHRFRFESLKRSDVIYRMNLYNSQFVECDYGQEDYEIVMKAGNKVLYSHGYAVSFANMCSYYMTIPYKYRDVYKPLGFSCEDMPWDDRNIYKKAQKLKHDEISPELRIFIKMMRRSMKIDEVLD